MGKRAELEVNFETANVPLPPDMVDARRASLLLLLQWVNDGPRLPRGYWNVARLMEK